MVIVTQNQYILAKTIHHITLNENVEYVELKINGKFTQVKCETFSINITYTPDVQSPNSRDDWRECMVVLRNKNRAYKAYKELIHQIREQNPDQLFLDKVMESILSSDYILNDKENDDFELEEKRYDGRTKKIRSIRKTKARSKKVLRKSKRSN
jgi:hypothetical protein